MIWLAWRRHRTNLLISLGLVIALIVWMMLVRHWFDTAPLVRIVYPGERAFYVPNYARGPLIFRLPYQVEAINAALLLLPCILGVLLGVPLVAAELADHTNRLAWTQSIGRTRWLITKWVVVGIPPALAVTVIVLVTRWWSHRAFGTGIGFLDPPTNDIPGFNDLAMTKPSVYSVTGLVPVAYTLFAVALGAALGALEKRATLAAVGTIVIYGVALLVMITVVRPNLAPKTFVSDSGTASGNSGIFTSRTLPWTLGNGFRFVPGYLPTGGASADALGNKCDQTRNAGNCYTSDHIESGTYYQPTFNYWKLQWRESAIYVAVTAMLLAVGLWAVRRWRA